LERIEDTLELIKLIESTRVKAIAVHGRTKEERPQDQNRNHVIKATAQSVSIPVIANGGSQNINTNSDIELFRRETCASSVMIARATQKNCSIFVKQESLLPIENVIKEYLKLLYNLMGVFGHNFNIINVNFENFDALADNMDLIIQLLISRTVTFIQVSILLRTYNNSTTTLIKPIFFKTFSVSRMSARIVEREPEDLPPLRQEPFQSGSTPIHFKQRFMV